MSGTKNKSAVTVDVASTLTAEMEQTKCVPIVLTEKRFFEWHEDTVSVTLRNSSGSYGGGSECLIIEEK